MSYPPPPGLKSLPASLPARPPPSSVNPPPPSFKPNNVATKPAFTAFAPRAIASTVSAQTASPAHYAAQPQYSSTPTYTQPSPTNYAGQSYDQQFSGSAPQIRNPFAPGNVTQPNNYGAPANYDPDYEAQIQQWQSAYIGNDNKSSSGIATTAKVAPTTPLYPTSSTPTPQATEVQKTVKRTGGGTEWTDSTLLEWDPAHFRLFVGNLAGEVTDESLLKAFIKYPSVQKARVVRDKRTTKSKGYGFVSFENGDDYFRAFKEMNNKYIGSHPVTITKARTEVKPSTVKDKRKGKGGLHGKVDHGGVEKKVPKMKGGLKVLG